MAKTITWVGMDVHKDTIAMALFKGAVGEPEIREILNEPKLVRRVFTKLKAEGHELRCCYEAGPCGYELWRELNALGIACDVVAPSLVPKKPGERVKTDRRDAVKLGRNNRAGELTPVLVPTPEDEAARDLVRASEDVRKDLIVARNRLTKFLLRHGRVFREGCAWTQRYWCWLAKQEFEIPALRITLRDYVLQVQHQQQRRADLEREIGDLALTPAYRERVERLSCLRGLSTLGAMSLITEIQDFRRFQSPRQLMAFLGVVPSESSSGGKVQRGAITKAGNSHARRLLIEAAWTYRHPPKITLRARRLLKHQPPEITTLVRKANARLHRRFQRLIGRGKKPQVAVTAIARELTGFVWAMMTQHAC